MSPRCSLITGRSLRARYADRLNRLDPDTARLFTVALGLTMGVLVTITSVGAGAIGVTVLLLLHPKMPVSRIVGSDIAHGVPLTLLAGAGHWYLGSVDRSLLGNLLIGSLPGIVFGSYLATRARDTVVRDDTRRRPCHCRRQVAALTKVRFGSEADEIRWPRQVRFPLIADSRQTN